MTRAKRGEAEQWLRGNQGYRSDECLEWPFRRTRGGYGSVLFDGVPTTASRAMCMLAHGKPPGPKMHAAHSCGNRGCVNPQHLRWATVSENHMDKWLHGTMPKGGEYGASKLTEGAAKEIFSKSGEVPQQELARDFSVCQQTISNIQTGRTWGWATDGR